MCAPPGAQPPGLKGGMPARPASFEEKKELPRVENRGSFPTVRPEDMGMCLSAGYFAADSATIFRYLSVM